MVVIFFAISTLPEVSFAIEIICVWDFLVDLNKFMHLRFVSHELNKHDWSFRMTLNIE